MTRRQRNQPWPVPKPRQQATWRPAPGQPSASYSRRRVHRRAGGSIPQPAGGVSRGEDDHKVTAICGTDGTIIICRIIHIDRPPKLPADLLATLDRRGAGLVLRIHL